MPSTFRPLHLVVSDAKLYHIPGCIISMCAIANSTTVAHENATRSTFLLKLAWPRKEARVVPIIIDDLVRLAIVIAPRDLTHVTHTE